MRSLEALLWPVEAAAFLEHDWTVRTRYIGGRSGKWDRAMTTGEFAGIVRMLAHCRPGELGLYAHGTRDDAATVRLVASIVAGDDGLAIGDRTLYVRRISRYHAPLFRIVVGLYNDLHEVAYINAYYSPADGEPGLGPHFDAWDIVVLQIAGSKRWELWDGVASHPVEACDPKRDRCPRDRPLGQLVTTAGDLLYLPRGMWHLATPTDEFSLHITIGIHCKSGLDLARWLGRDGEANSELGRTLPRLDVDAPFSGVVADRARDIANLASDPTTRGRYALESFAADYAEIFDGGYGRYTPGVEGRGDHVHLGSGPELCGALDEGICYSWRADAVIRTAGGITCVGIGGNIFRIEGSGARIFSRLQYPASLVEVTTAVAADLEMPVDALASDIRAFIAQLCARGLLCTTRKELAVP